jgi:hypothetical protein
MTRHALAAAAALLLLAGAAPMTEAQEKRLERTISVSATGTVAAEPDQAHISTGVVSEAETAREALARNTQAMRKVIDGLKAAGIGPKDIATTAFHVEPRYQNYKDGRAATITGYRVINQVRILARDIARFGEVLDQAVSLGANQIHGISFEVSTAETLKDEARRKAMENALRRARLYAAASGAGLGDVITISEEVIGGHPRPVTMARASMSAEAVPIERGSQTLEVRVHVVWGLK